MLELLLDIKNKFTVKYLGLPKLFLSIELDWSESENIGMRQLFLVQKLLTKTGIDKYM